MPLPQGGHRYNEPIIASAADMTATSSMPLRAVLILGICAASAACSTITEKTRSVASAIAPYKVEIVQGNFVSREQVEALQPGMTRAQVRDILGTPLLQSVFHADRWDYVFTMQRKGAEPQARQLSVYFKGDALERAEGDPMPSETEFVTLLGAHHKARPVPELEASEDKLKAIAPPRDAAARPPAPAAASTAPLPTSYPPLEAPAR